MHQLDFASLQAMAVFEANLAQAFDQIKPWPDMDDENWETEVNLYQEFANRVIRLTVNYYCNALDGYKPSVTMTLGKAIDGKLSSETLEYIEDLGPELVQACVNYVLETVENHK